MYLVLVISRVNGKESKTPSDILAQLSSDWDSSNCSETRILSEGVCLPHDYLRADLPLAVCPRGKCVSIDSITVNAESKILNIRDVDDKMQTVTFDISVHLQWRDDRIKVKPSPGVKQNFLGSWNVLESNKISTIWNPDLMIYNMKNFKRPSILNPTNGFLKIHADGHFDEILVDYVFNAEVTIYCDFNFRKYPMDEQICELRMGSISYGRYLKFVLWSRTPGVAYERTYSEEPPQNFSSKGFKMSVKQFTDNFTDCIGARAESERCKAKHIQHVVFDIRMKRFLQPYFMHYYAPCIAIVLVTQTSFIIPPECIPGRVALLVTQFLTLVNIFIDQQVVAF